jgi:hypothetical protein
MKGPKYQKGQKERKIIIMPDKTIMHLSKKTFFAAFEIFFVI